VLSTSNFRPKAGKLGSFSRPGKSPNFTYSLVIKELTPIWDLSKLGSFCIFLSICRERSIIVEFPTYETFSRGRDGQGQSRMIPGANKFLSHTICFLRFTIYDILHTIYVLIIVSKNPLNKRKNRDFRPKISMTYISPAIIRSAFLIR